jgi:hypothetical protein
MSSEFPKIELFVSDVSLEFPPVSKVREVFSIDPSAGNQSAWYEGDWGHDWDDSYSGPGADEYGRPVIPDAINIKDIMLREESFGGLIYIPSTRRVLKANKVGLDIVKALQSGALDNNQYLAEHVDVVKNILTNEKVKQ